MKRENEETKKVKKMKKIKMVLDTSIFVGRMFKFTCFVALSVINDASLLLWGCP